MNCKFTLRWEKTYTNPANYLKKRTYTENTQIVKHFKKSQNKYELFQYKLIVPCFIVQLLRTYNCILGQLLQIKKITARQQFQQEI